MKYAELNEQGFVTGINNVGGDGWVSCEGLTDWQIQHQGELRYVKGAWDVSAVPAEFAEAEAVLAESAPMKNDHAAAIKEALAAITVATDTISKHLSVLVE